MMAAHPYPSGQHGVAMSPTQPHSRNMYNLNSGPTATTPVSAHTQFSYPTPTHPHSNLYRSPVPELSTFGLITPPTTTPSQFGSPLIASGGYTPQPVGTPTGHQWGTLNALALSPMGSIDPSLAYGYHHPSPILGQDPTCANPGEVFSSVPLRHHDHHMGDALGFHHPGYPGHPGAVYRTGPGLGLKAGPHGHLILGADGQPTTEIKKRSRTAQACERCRIRKARCFGGNPCNRCTKRRFQCEFSTAVRQRGPNKPPQVNASVTGGNGPTSAPPATSSTGSLANGKPATASTSPTPNTTSTTSAASSGSSAGTPTSPTTKGPRRHSLPEGPTQQYIPHPPSKSFSTTEVPRLASVSEEAVNYTVVPHLPATSAEYLAVPAPASGGGLRTDASFFPTTPTIGTSTPGSGPASACAEPSPMFAYTPEMENVPSSAPTTGSSVDYPYTPISPATNFSPTLGMTPTVNGHPNAVNYFQQDQTYVNA